MEPEKPVSEKAFLAALEKLHTDTSGVQGLGTPNPDKPWLNTTENVSAIVRNFASEVFRRLSLLGDDFTSDAFNAWAQSECDRMNHLFLTYGLSPDVDYTRGIWNTPQNLGVFLQIANGGGDEGDAGKAVRDAFMRLVVALTEAYVENHDAPVESWGWKIDALVEDLIANLLGLHEYDESLSSEGGVSQP